MKRPTARAAEIGEELPVLRKTIVQRQIDCYSGVRPHSIHTDPEYARRKGFKGALVQAMMSTAYVSEMMVQRFGAGFVQGGRISVAFTKPVYAGDTLTVHGRVTGREPDDGRTRVTVEVWCENEEGVMTMAGTASGLE